MNTKTEEKKDGKAAATATEEKKEVAKTQPAEMPKVEDVKKLLDVQIHKWEQLSIKIEHRERFIRTKDQIKEFSETLKNEKDKNNPDQEAFFLKLSSSESYNGRAEISVNNTFIIEEFLNFIAAKIETKILQLEKEIVM
jgi:hypothetical protein